MDNLCHTLAGLAIGEAGLKRKTALAIPTLLIGANLPDLDVLSYAWGPVAALGFRRGWTHGILATAVWPLVLAGLMLAWDRGVRRRRDPQAEPARGGGLLLLAALSVWSHPLLDFLNSYGVRALMPFSGRWFYGDALFIVDLWVWAALGVGAFWSRNRWRAMRDAGGAGARRAGRPARVALAGVAAYIVLMAGSAVRERAFVAHAMAAHAPGGVRVMVAPLPLSPVHRQVVVELPDAYALGTLALVPRRHFIGRWVQVPKHDRLPGAEAIAETPTGRTYLGWARFPYFVFGEDCEPDHACLRDARYYREGWAEVAVPVGGTITLLPSLPPGTTP